MTYVNLSMPWSDHHQPLMDTTCSNAGLCLWKNPIFYRYSSCKMLIPMIFLPSCPMIITDPDPTPSATGSAYLKGRFFLWNFLVSILVARAPQIMGMGLENLSIHIIFMRASLDNQSIRSFHDWTIFWSQVGISNIYQKQVYYVSWMKKNSEFLWFLHGCPYGHAKGPWRPVLLLVISAKPSLHVDPVRGKMALSLQMIFWQ